MKLEYGNGQYQVEIKYRVKTSEASKGLQYPS